MDQGIKIFVHGAECTTCQVSRIKKGFQLLGHTITPYIQEADLIYSNNFWRDQIIEDKKNGLIKGKIIFNILDLAPQYKDNGLLERCNKENQFADAISVISETVKEDCLKRLNQDKKHFTIIYQPIMGVYYDPSLYRKSQKYKYLMAGRCCDPFKRQILSIRAMQTLGISEFQVAVTGSEYPNFGIDLGIIEENELNKIYNNVDFVFVPSQFEGIGLQILEAMACKTIPIVLADLNTREEFLPSKFFPEYLDIHNHIDIARFIELFSPGSEIREAFINRLYYHYKANLEHKFSPIGVASKIIEIYKNIQ
jgi:hypothetical protein